MVYFEQPETTEMTETKVSKVNERVKTKYLGIRKVKVKP